MSLLTAGELAAFRADAEGEMTLTLAWFSPNGTTTDSDGQKIPAFATETATAGKAQGPSQQATQPYTRTVNVGGVERPVMEGGIHIPIGAAVPQRFWECQVTALGADDDPALLDRRYRVESVPAKSFATARRLDVIEVPIPASVASSSSSSS